jgi:hypothetical protein
VAGDALPTGYGGPVGKLRAQVVIPADTNIPEDVCVNTWGFVTSLAIDATSMDTATARLVTFYNALQNYRANNQNWAATRIKFYDLEQAIPRPPLRDAVMGLSATAAANSLPAEVALCLSFQGVQVAGTSQARRRGRVYLGPWGTSANNGLTGRPDNGLTAAIIPAARALVLANDQPLQWCVYSQFPAADTPIIVTNGWCDDAWDTQRRRGPRPTLRTVFNNIP